MPVTNQSSTRSRQLWVATLHPSRIHRFLLLAIGLAASRSLFILDLTVLWQMLYAIVSLIILTLLFRRNRQSHRLTHHHDGSWSLSRFTTPPTTSQTPVIMHKGQLCHSGYRSANLLVLVFVTDGGSSDNTFNDSSSRLVRLPIWSDQIESSDFSYLHLQLAYAATPLPPLKERLIASLRYTRRHSFKTGCRNETTDLSRR